MKNTHKTVNNMVELQGDILQALSSFNELPLDFQGEAILIKEDRILLAIDLYLDGKISALNLQQWADALEVSDYIDYETDNVRSSLFILSSPEINCLGGVISKENVEELKFKIEQNLPILKEPVLPAFMKSEA